MRQITTFLASHCLYFDKNCLDPHDIEYKEFQLSTWQSRLHWPGEHIWRRVFTFCFSYLFHILCCFKGLIILNMFRTFFICWSPWSKMKLWFGTNTVDFWKEWDSAHIWIAQIISDYILMENEAWKEEMGILSEYLIQDGSPLLPYSLSSFKSFIFNLNIILCWSMKILPTGYGQTVCYNTNVYILQTVAGTCFLEKWILKENKDISPSVR